MTTTATPALLDRIDAYLDAVPRSRSRAERIGPFTLFVPAPGAFPLYARPSLSRSGSPPEPAAADVRAVLDRQNELRLARTFEWLAGRPAGLGPVLAAEGLAVADRPLLVLDEPVAVPPPDGVTVRDATDEDIPAALAVQIVGFAHAGSAVGAAGPVEAAAVEADPARVADLRERARLGLSHTVVAAGPDGTVLGAGSHQPVGEVTEVVGVATLPSARRRGIAAAVTAGLVADARRRGVTLAFLSAGDEAAARVYERAGFRRVGTFHDAELPG